MAQLNRRLLQQGFSIVELVVSIALLAIVAATASSRWFSADTFSTDTIKSQLLAEARLAQRTALTNSQAEVRLNVSQVGGSWRCQIIQESGGVETVLRETLTDSDGVSIQVTAGGVSTLNTGQALDLRYDGLGNISGVNVGGVAGSVSGGVSLTFSNERTFCVSPLGFAHDGECV
jgi:prepilin-type N-terminal cleavage/methylation domain-containing protein